MPTATPPDDHGPLRTLDGRVLDVAVHIREETVSVVIVGTDTLTLSPAGARALASLLMSGADVLEGKF